MLHVHVLYVICIYIHWSKNITTQFIIKQQWSHDTDLLIVCMEPVGGQNVSFVVQVTQGQKSLGPLKDRNEWNTYIIDSTDKIKQSCDMLWSKKCHESCVTSSQLLCALRATAQKSTISLSRLLINCWSVKAAVAPQSSATRVPRWTCQETLSGFISTSFSIRFWSMKKRQHPTNLYVGLSPFQVPVSGFL